MVPVSVRLTSRRDAIWPAELARRMSRMHARRKTVPAETRLSPSGRPSRARVGVWNFATNFHPRRTQTFSFGLDHNRILPSLLRLHSHRVHWPDDVATGVPHVLPLSFRSLQEWLRLFLPLRYSPYSFSFLPVCHLISSVLAGQVIFIYEDLDYDQMK
jgi:hypothetical protein